jgi:DNA-directed RNA polymerase specialized sigma24 family protein
VRTRVFDKTTSAVTIMSDGHVAAHHCPPDHRRLAVAPVTSEFRVQGPPVSDDHWNDVDAALQSRLVGAALHRLSAKHRDVLLECFYRGCSIAEGAIAGRS